jgi:hypothetical protein
VVSATDHTAVNLGFLDLVAFSSSDVQEMVNSKIVCGVSCSNMNDVK